MNLEKTFAAMRQIVEAPNYPYLTAYKDDFYKHDRMYLERTCAPGNRYLWVVRKHGTHLIRLDVHPKMAEEGLAVLNLESVGERFLVAGDKVMPVDDAQARKLLASFTYAMFHGAVSKGGVALAQLAVDVSPWSSGRREGRVHYTSWVPVAAMTLGDLVALRQIAECEVIKATQSLFTPTTEVTLDGEDLWAIIDARRADCRIVA